MLGGAKRYPSTNAKVMGIARAQAVPGIFASSKQEKTRLAGTKPAMTKSESMCFSLGSLGTMHAENR
jgi:hypothetical protein